MATHEIAPTPSLDCLIAQAMAYVRGETRQTAPERAPGGWSGACLGRFDGFDHDAILLCERVFGSLLSRFGQHADEARTHVDIEHIKEGQKKQSVDT